MRRWGRFALASQERGYAVTALDNSPGAVEVSAAGECVTPCWPARRTGRADRGPPGAYDTFLLMGENLGLLGDPGEQAAAFLAGLAAAASPARPGSSVTGPTRPRR